MKKLLWTLVLVLVVAAAAAHQLGWAGKLAGSARVIAAPEDAGLVAYFPAESEGLAVVHLPIRVGKTHPKLDQRWSDFSLEVERISGVRLAVDVDAIAAGPRLLVARGRFDWDRMSERLQAAGYTVSNLEGTPMAVKEQGGEAIAVDGAYAIVATLDEVERALQRKRDGAGLKKGSAVLAAAEDVGWRHLSFGAVQLSNQQAGLGDLLSGKVQLRSIAFAVDRATQATAITVVVAAGALPQAREIEAMMKGARAEMVEQLRKNPEQDAQEAARVLEAMTIAADEEARVRVGVVVPDAFGRRLLDEKGAQVPAALGGAAGTRALVEGFLRGAFAR